MDRSLAFRFFVTLRSLNSALLLASNGRIQSRHRYPSIA
jgi:hypothetical protein